MSALRALRAPQPAVPEEIRAALRRFRRRVRWLWVLKGTGLTVALAAILFGASLALDRWTVLSSGARIALTVAAISATALSFLLTVFLPIVRPITDRRAARGLEFAAPALEERLISTLELIEDGAPAEASRGLVEALARSTAVRVSGLEVARLIDPRPARVRVIAAAALLLILLAIAGSDRRGFALLSDRFLHPGQELPRPSSVGLRVLPGDTVIGVDDDLAVEAAVTRGRPPRVVVRFRVPGGEWRSEAMEPRIAGEAAAAAPAAEFRHLFRRARQTFEYQVQAADFSSPVHLVEVRERPRPERFTITYHYPAYTRRPDSTAGSARGDLSAVAGTVADLEVACSGHPVIGRFIESGAPGATPLGVTAAAGADELVRARIEIKKSGAYQILLEDRSGVSNRGGESYSIQAEADRPPRVRVTIPRTLEVVVEDAGRLEIGYEVQDDFGIEALAVVAGAEGGADRPAGVPGSGGGGPAEPAGNGRRFPIALDDRIDAGEEKSPPRTVVNGTYRWDLATLGLRPGESISFRLVAADGLGQTGASPEMVLRMAFVPDPPEGADWLAGLREIQRGLDGALAGWSAALGTPGGERAESFAPDPARADQLGRLAEEVLKQLARLRQLGETAAAVGRSIPIPSVNRTALANLGAALRRIADVEGQSFWAEAVGMSGRIREALRAKGPPEGAAAGALYAAHDRGSAALIALQARFTAIHRAERVEAALERLRALLAAEEEMISRARDLAGAAPAAPAAPRLDAARLQQNLRIEATSLGAELAGIARLGGPEDGPLAALSLAYLQAAAPPLDASQKAWDAGDPGLAAAPLGAAARAFGEAAASLERESVRLEEAARAARERLDPSPDLSRRLAALGAAESAAAEGLSKRGAEALREAADGDRARRPELLLLGSDFEEAASASEKAQPADFESAADLHALRDIFHGLSEGPLTTAAARTEELRLARADPSRSKPPAPEDLAPVIADRRRAAEVLDGLARALAGVEPGARLGRRARHLDAIAETEETIAWQLRSAAPGAARSLRARAGIERELRIAAGEIGAALAALVKDLPEGAPLRPAVGAALPDIAAVAIAAEAAAAACLTGDPPRALAAALEAARKAGEASRRLDEARAALPALAAARAWIQSQTGSLPDQVEKLAQAQRAHAETLERLVLELGGPQAGGPATIAPIETERVAALAVDEEQYRAEATRLAALASREAGRIASMPIPGNPRQDLAVPIRQLDLAAERIQSVSRGEMARAAKAVGAAVLATSAAAQRGFLEPAAEDEERAAAMLSDVARALRLLDEREAVESQESEIQKLLSRSGAPPADPADARRAAEEARALLDGVLRAAEILSVRLPEGVLKAELLDRLRGAAEKFRAALEAGTAGEGEKAVSLIAEGRALLAEAVAVARRIRGDTDQALAAAEASGAEGKDQKPMSRELQEVYAELRKIQALREQQARIDEEFADLLRDRARPDLMEVMKEAAKLEGELAEELGKRFLAASELVQLVADLLAGGNEARRLGEEERKLGAEVSAAGDAAGRAAALHARQEKLSAAGAEMAGKLKGAGVKLSINLPSILKAYWEAEAHLAPALQAMHGAGAALGEGRLPGAGEGLERAAAELGVLTELLGIARQRALEEIAARAEEDSGEDSGRRGMEEAQDAMKRAAQEMALGRPESAQAQQGAAMRGLTSAAEAMRSRLARTRFEAGRDALLAQAPDPASGIPGLSWEVLIRGDMPEAAKKDQDTAKPGDAALDAAGDFPEEFRELVRIYLRALAGGR